MKKKLLLILVLPLLLASCTKQENPLDNTSHEIISTDQANNIKAYIDEAKVALQDLVKETLEESASTLIKNSVNAFLVQETAYLDSIQTEEEAINATTTIYDHELEFTANTLKPVFNQALNEELVPLINSIKDENVRNECSSEYTQALSHEEINYEIDIIGVHNVFQSLYNLVKDFVNHDNPGDPGEPVEPVEPVEPEVNLEELIDNAKNEIISYTEDVIDALSYPDVFSLIWSFYYEQIEKFQNVTTEEDIALIKEDIKGLIMGFAHESSAEAAIGDLTYYFEEMEEAFTKQEVLNIISQLKQTNLQQLEKYIDWGMELVDYQIVVENFKIDIQIDFWDEDIYTFYIQDLNKAKLDILEIEKDPEFVEDIDTLYSNYCSLIQNYRDLLDYEEHVINLIEQFKTDANDYLTNFKNK